MSKLNKKIILKINEEKIKPKSKWNFLIKDYSLWLLFGLSVVLGSLASSVIWFVVLKGDWDIYIYPHETFWNNLAHDLPYIWFGYLAIFIIFAYYMAKITKTGYRHHPYLIVLGSIIVSLAVGLLLHAGEIGEKVEANFANSIKAYRSVIKERQQKWCLPKKGLLVGKIVHINDENIELQSPGGAIWHLNIAGAVLSNDVHLEKGANIKVIGDLTLDHNFVVKEIRKGSWLDFDDRDICQEGAGE